MKNKINDTNINIDKVNFRDSGIHGCSETFYQTHKNIFNFDDNGYIKYEQYEELIEENNYFEDEIQEYINELDEEDKENDEEELRSEAIDSIIEKIIIWLVYFEPQEFNKEIAKKCGLVAFTYNDIELLGLNGCGMDFSPRLDAYQALTTGTIDKNSKLFGQTEYFEHVIGKELTQEVIKAIQKEVAYA
jgi:hypothetical protein